MADLQGNTSSNDVEQEIEVINQKRSALQHLVKLTSTFSRLHQGLNSIILMGSANTQIPEKIINSFKKISEKLTAHPTDQLKNTLASSDIKINRDIKQVLEISLKDETSQAVEIDSRGETTSSLLENNYQNYVDDFKKNAQTSIALRITLKSRNVAVKPFNLSVPENFIKQQIKNLDQKETHCRSKIKQDMDSLDKDMHRLIKRVDFPQEARERLNRMRAELRENIDHFYKDGPP
ncbi:MAG: hypothetical protein OEY43_07505, partial [Gammaproteobacteria bacterium]|nr:hypothetical protein [Gammaproteobacteria bacterium]